MKIGLASVTYLGIWYDGVALPLRDVLATARRLGYDGVEINGKRPHGFPLDLDRAARDEIRAAAAAESMDIPALSANNDFTSPIPEQLEAQVLLAVEQVRLASDLGAPIVRMFLAWPGVALRGDGVAQYDAAHHGWEESRRVTTRQEMWERARRALREVARHAEAAGVTLALQNHAPLVRHHRDVLDMVAEVASPSLRVCLDAPLLLDHSDAAVRGAVRDVGALQAHSHVLGEFERDADGGIVQRPIEIGLAAPLINYPAFVDELARIGYDGWLCYEFCHPAIDAGHVFRGRDFVDDQVELAGHYFRELVAAAAPAGAAR